MVVICERQCSSGGQWRQVMAVNLHFPRGPISGLMGGL